MGKIKYRIGSSTIHGRGAFATEKIRSGTRVVEYVGERVSEEEADRRAELSECVWLFDLEDGTFIDGDQSSDGACVNHSCDPNCTTEIANGRVYILSERTIEPGEELVYDYRFEAEMEEWPCRCGAEDCRGTINLQPQPKPVKKRKQRARGKRRH